MKLRTISYIFILIAVSLATGCALFLGPQEDEPLTGELTLRITDVAAVKNLLAPAFDMNAESLYIEGIGPFDESFSETISIDTTQFSQTELVTGTWDISVSALNGASQIVGSGAAQATIIENQSVSVTINVRPVIGVGTLDITVSWPALTLDNPTVVGTLTSAEDSSETPIAFSVDAGTGLSANFTNSVPTGYYHLFIQLDDTQGRTWQHYVAVRIIADKTTAGTIPLHLNQTTGDLEIIIDVDLENPVDITITDVPPSVTFGASFTASLLLNPADTGSYVYKWYLNGVEAAGEINATLSLSHADLLPGTNQIVVAVEIGNNVSAATAVTDYTNALPAPVVTGSAQSSDDQPTWTWSSTPDAVGFRYGFNESTWIAEGCGRYFVYACFTACGGYAHPLRAGRRRNRHMVSQWRVYD